VRVRAKGGLQEGSGRATLDPQPEQNLLFAESLAVHEEHEVIWLVLHYADKRATDFGV
jgi:hypothetical protein